MACYRGHFARVGGGLKWISGAGFIGVFNDKTSDLASETR